MGKSNEIKFYCWSDEQRKATQAITAQFKLLSLQEKSGVRLRGGNCQFTAVIPSHFFLILRKSVLGAPSLSCALEVVGMRCRDREEPRRL